jgi:hypothetical protein
MVFKSFVLCTYLYELFIKRPTWCAYILAGIVGHVSFFAVQLYICLVCTAIATGNWVRVYHTHLARGQTLLAVPTDYLAVLCACQGEEHR